MNRGRITEARAAVERLTVIGVSMNDPRSLGYATAMKALIAILSDNYEAGLEIADARDQHVPRPVRKGHRDIGAKHRARAAQQAGRARRSRRLHRQMRGERLDAVSKRPGKSLGGCARVERADPGRAQVHRADDRPAREGGLSGVGGLVPLVPVRSLSQYSFGRRGGVARAVPAEFSRVDVGDDVRSEANRRR